MLLAGLHSGFVLFTILIVDVHSSCLISKTCPCGTSGKNYTRCYDTEIENYSCERWANCQTCRADSETCLSCPPGRYGATCRDGPCPLLKRPKFGSFKCSVIGSFISSCTARCLPDYQFENEQMTEEITLKCYQNVWTPRQQFPECIGVYASRQFGLPKFTKKLYHPTKVDSQPRRWSAFLLTSQPRDGFMRFSRVQTRRFYIALPIVSAATGKECALKIMGNGGYNCTTRMDGIYCDITCNNKRQGRYHCLPGRRWNSTLPFCVKGKKEKAICPDPGTPEAGGRVDQRGNPFSSGHTFKEGDAVFYFCNERGVILQGRSYLTCKSDSTWDANLPQCVLSQKEEKVELKTSCKFPGVVENGIIEDYASETEQFSIGTKLRFICREGYEIEGPNAIYCLRNFSWSEAPPICKQIDAITASTPTANPSCKHPGSVENGFIVEDVSETQSFPIGSVLNFQCTEGHEMDGAASIQCLPSVNQHSYWSGIPPYCRNIVTKTTMKTPAKSSCKHPGIIENGFIENYPQETESFPVGTALEFRCEGGYEIEGPKRLFCLLSSEWSDGLPNCRFIPTTAEVTCEHPGMVKNGEFEGDRTQSTFLVGTPLTINCIEGTQIEGPMTIYCLRNGMWSDALPTCKLVTEAKRQVIEKTSTALCRHPGMIENGANENGAFKVTAYTVGSEIKFKCKNGYTIKGTSSLYCLSNGQWTSAPPICVPQEKIPDCGRVFQEVYHMTGEYTRSDWPWTVGISTVSEDDIEKMFCVGALINSRTVLTAAHCATTAQNIKLHFGHRKQADAASVAPQSEQVRNVSRSVIHPEYDGVTHVNDIALMKFDQHVYYDQRTQPICLPTPELNISGRNLHPGAKATVTGYGLEFTPYQHSTAKFKMVELYVQSEKKCENVCKNQGLVSCSPSAFCATSAKNIQECMYGGSPLVVYHPGKNRYTLEGLVTRPESARNQWNGRCKQAENYITFTNVTTFMPFILENLN